ncbi:MAG: hypothetical protein AB7P17_14970 [Nitrospirales bacterium]|nr:hypothetical protein [Nitrospirales bacterium]
MPRSSSTNNTSAPALFKLFDYRWLLLALALAGLYLTELEGSHILAAPAPKAPFSPPVETELALAKTKSLYMVVDLPNNLAVLKARGITLRTFPLQGINWIGSPLGLPLNLHLKGKDPMISPLPISPPPVIDNTAPLDEDKELSNSPPPAKALTVSDMPLRYDLVFDNQIVVIVQPHHLPAFWDNAFQQFASWAGRVAAHVATWKEMFGQSSDLYLVLSMEPADAQAFYWAIVAPMPWLVFPGEQNTHPS